MRSKKWILLMVSIIVGASIISFSVVSFTLCNFERNTNYDLQFDSSGIILKDLNKTIYVRDTFNDVNTWIDICNGNLARKSYELWNENCTRTLLQRGIPDSKLINGTTLQLNTKDLRIIEKGFFCLDKKWL